MNPRLRRAADVYRLLVKAGLGGYGGGAPPDLAIAPNNLSFHLKAMTHAGLLSVAQEGRFQRYRANIPLMLDLIAFLTEGVLCRSSGAVCLASLASSCSPAVLPSLAPELNPNLL